MRLFARLSDLVSANVHALLDRVEDPETMLAQIVREMEEGLATARAHAATAIGAERRLGRELARQRGASEQCRTAARTALLAGREDLARRELLRKLEHDAVVIELDVQHAQSVATSAEVRATLRTLESRLAQARRQQRVFIARQRAARARHQLCRLGVGVVPDPASPAAKFQRLEDRLTDLEDDLAARFELDAVCDVAPNPDDAAIDAELAELKRELPPAQ